MKEHFNLSHLNSFSSTSVSSSPRPRLRTSSRLLPLRSLFVFRFPSSSVSVKLAGPSSSRRGGFRLCFHAGTRCLCRTPLIQAQVPFMCKTCTVPMAKNKITQNKTNKNKWNVCIWKIVTVGNILSMCVCACWVVCLNNVNIRLVFVCLFYVSESVFSAKV